MSIEGKKMQIESILSGLNSSEALYILKKIVNERLGSSLIGFSDVDIPHFPKVLEIQETRRLFLFLMGDKYIDSNTDENIFLYHFGCYYGIPDNVKPIKWIETKQLLRELLEPLYCIVMNKADIKKLAMKCFADKNGKTMILAKNKCIPSTKSDDLKEFLATNKLSNNQS